MKRRTFRAFIVLVILAVFVATGIAGYSLYQKYIGLKNDSDRKISVTEKENQQDKNERQIEADTETKADNKDQQTASNELPEDSYFEIDFFDVGEADCTLIKCDGHTLLVDGGNPGNSSFLYSYLKQNDINYLDYIVCTHAHEDHVGGLAGAMNYANVGVVYAPVTEYDTRAFNSFVKYLNQQGKTITVPTAGDVFMLGNSKVEIKGPVDMSLAEENENNSSIILRIVYGETSFLITGDAEAIEEQSILDAGFDVKCTVLRVGHHGSYTSTTGDFLEAADPEYCVISVGRNNAFGHPHDVVINRIKEYNVRLFRTDLNGDIVCTSDGETVRFRTDK